MKVLLIGPQGSGKSTQADYLADYLKVPKVTLGDIFRQLAEQDTEAGKRIKEILEKGQLVDDYTASRMMREELSRKDYQNGFVIDGYPRTLEQAGLFDPMYDKVFYLKLEREEIMKRLLKRGREDDTEELIKIRLDLYYQQTQPLLDYYRNLGNLVEINASGAVEEIERRIRDYVKK